MARRAGLRRLQVHRPSRTDLHGPRQTTLQSRLRRRQTHLRSLRQPSRLHRIHNPGRHNACTRNPRRRPHQHGKERIRRHGGLRKRTKRRILPIRHRRNEHRHRRHREEDPETLQGGKEANTRNARRLSPTLPAPLHERGFQVLGEKKGFTRSHLLVADITKFGDGKTIEKKLEDANIILNRNLLPYDIKAGRHFEAPGGIRCGVSEVTRLGMKESEMVEIADFMTRIVVKGEDSRKVATDVADFRREYQKVHYAFETSKDAYTYIHIR